MCQGQVEVYLHNQWHTVDSRSWGQSLDPWKDPKQASKFCQKLNCGDAVGLGHFPHFNSPQNHIICDGPLGSLSRCNSSKVNQRGPLGLICLGE